MDKEKLKNIQAETPLSLADSAPRTIELDCGLEVRIDGMADKRILNAIIDKVPEVNEVDFAVCQLYLAMHTKKSDITKLWRQSMKDPKKLFEKIIGWAGGQGFEKIIEAMNELGEIQEAINESEDGGDDGQDPEETAAKKKTG